MHLGQVPLHVNIQAKRDPHHQEPPALKAPNALFMQEGEDCEEANEKEMFFSRKAKKRKVYTEWLIAGTEGKFDEGLGNKNSKSGKEASVYDDSMPINIFSGASSAGRGHGVHLTKPAWLTCRDSLLLFQPTRELVNSPLPVPLAGRRRGVHFTKPAWLTQQEKHSLQHGPSGMPRNTSG